MRSITLAKLKHYIREGFGNNIFERSFLSKESSNRFVILQADGPYDDFISYSTYGVSKIILNGSKGPIPFGLEILSGAPKKLTEYPKILVVAHEYFLQENNFLGPGNVLVNAVKKAKAGFEHLPHLYFTLPVYWEGYFDLLKIDDTEVRFLVTFPISDNEYLFLKTTNRDNFENYFIKNQVDIFNPERACSNPTSREGHD